MRRAERRRRPVVVVGGGVAGLSAATALAERGREVVVLEASRLLGGRARSFADRETGDPIDNGQHALMGCYDHFLALLARVGMRGALRESELKIPFWSCELGLRNLDCSALPAPLHVAAGLARYGHLSLRDRVATARQALRLVRLAERGALADQTVASALFGSRRAPAAQPAFWDPVVWATLNSTSERASAELLATVVQRSLLTSREASRFLLPAVPLSELYAEPARKFIEARGGRVDTHSTVRGLALRNGRCEGVQVRGELLSADAVILAVPPTVVRRIAPGPVPIANELLRTTPIISVNLWLDGPVSGPPFMGLIGEELHWIFRITAIHETAPSERLACVKSSAEDWCGLSHDEIAERAWSTIRCAYPAARRRAVRHSVVVKEVGATLAPEPDVQRHRPGARTPIENLWLSGDWTDTHLPATLESAAQSGHVAAGCALGDFDG